MSGVNEALPQLAGQGGQHHVQVPHSHLSCFSTWPAAHPVFVWAPLWYETQGVIELLSPKIVQAHRECCVCAA